MFAHSIHGGAQKDFIYCQGWLITLSPAPTKIQIRYIQVRQNVSMNSAELGGWERTIKSQNISLQRKLHDHLQQ